MSFVSEVKLIDYFSSAMFIKYCNVLPKNRFQVPLLNLSRDLLAGIDEACCSNVLGREGYNGYVNEVKCVVVEDGRRVSAWTVFDPFSISTRTVAT